MRLDPAHKSDDGRPCYSGPWGKEVSKFWLSVRKSSAQKVKSLKVSSSVSAARRMPSSRSCSARAQLQFIRTSIVIALVPCPRPQKHCEGLCQCQSWNDDLVDWSSCP